MHFSKALVSAIALVACASMSAQSLEDTEAYILRELPQVMDPSERTEVLGFFVFEGSPEVVFRVKQVNPLDGKTRKWTFPLSSIDVYSTTDSYGTHLCGRYRAGGKFHVQCVCSDGSVTNLP